MTNRKKLHEVRQMLDFFGYPQDRLDLLENLYGGLEDLHEELTYELNRR